MSYAIHKMIYRKMTRKAEVSIITNFLNAEKFIQETIESVIEQSYDHWELLLVDDGSTDRSTHIARRYAEQYPGKIHYLEHEDHRNLGKSVSRNLGIRKARGKYLVFLDADDVLLPEKLEHQVTVLESRPEVVMVYGRTLYWYSWTGNPEDEKRDFFSKLGVRPDTLFEPPGLMTRFLRDSGMVPCLCSPLVHRQVVEDLGGFNEAFQHLYEDQVFLAKVCLHGSVLVQGEMGERYRQHPDSSSYRAVKNGEYDPIKPNPARLAFLNWLSQYLVEKNIQDVNLHKALRRSFLPYRYPNLFRLVSPVQLLTMQLKRHLADSIQK